jgi:hypothetical protein
MASAATSLSLAGVVIVGALGQTTPSRSKLKAKRERGDQVGCRNWRDAMGDLRQRRAVEARSADITSGSVLTQSRP